MNKQLKIQPLKKGYLPNYPSWEDPNPLLFPNTRPYPFRDRMLKYLAAAGFISSGLLATLIPNVSWAQKAELYNPFTFKDLGIPFRTSMFGTGLPSRMTALEIRSIIETAFKKEQIDLRSGVIYKEGIYAYELDGYNADMKIGYVFADYGRFGPGTSTSSFGRNQGDYKKRKYDLFISNKSEFLNKYFPFRKSYRAKNPKYLEKIKNENAQIAKNREPYEALDSSNISFNEFNEFVASIDYNNWKNRASNMSKDQEDALTKHLKNIKSFEDKMELIRLAENVFRYTSKNERVQQAVDSFVKKTCQEKRIGTFKRELQWFKKITNVIRRYPKKDIASTILQKGLSTDSKMERTAILRYISALQDAYSISYFEFKNMYKLMDQSEMFILPISIKDDRTIDYENVIRFRITDRTSYNESYKKKHPEATEAEINEKYDALQKVQLERERSNELQKLELRQKLEADVRMYIQWAKNQMGY